MEIRLYRYYGDETVTKSTVEVRMEGEEEPRLRCEARETRFKDYEEAFPGASQYCLPRGVWPLKCGGSPYSTMGARVVKCPGHRQVWLAPCQYFKAQQQVGRIIIGEPEYHFDTDPETGEQVECPPKRRMKPGRKVYDELEKLLYEAYGREEEMKLKIEGLKN